VVVIKRSMGSGSGLGSDVVSCLVDSLTFPFTTYPYLISHGLSEWRGSVNVNVNVRNVWWKYTTSATRAKLVHRLLQR
jgi:hypothetical protein